VISISSSILLTVIFLAIAWLMSSPTWSSLFADIVATWAISTVVMIVLVCAEREVRDDVVESGMGTDDLWGCIVMDQSLEAKHDVGRGFELRSHEFGVDVRGRVVVERLRVVEGERRSGGKERALPPIS
jgi:hypothetical protein